MGKRAELNELLESIMQPAAVYYQPPENLKMRYPCLRYSLSDIDAKKADDSLYLARRRYQMVYITRTVDPDAINTLMALPLCVYERMYAKDGLYHYLFNIYY